MRNPNPFTRCPVDSETFCFIQFRAIQTVTTQKITSNPVLQSGSLTSAVRLALFSRSHVHSYKHCILHAVKSLTDCLFLNRNHPPALPCAPFHCSLTSGLRICPKLQGNYNRNQKTGRLLAQHSLCSNTPSKYSAGDIKRTDGSS